MAANWVLSPISATKMATKVAAKSFQSISSQPMPRTDQTRVLQRIEWMQSRFAITSAGTVHYITTGNGEPLVLISNMLVMARSYRALISKLAESFQVIVVELPGSGWSSRVSEPASLEQYATCLIEFMNEIGLCRAILVGHSNSGAVAMRASQLSPERFTAVVLADSSGAGAAFLELAFNAVRHTRNFLSQIQWA